MEKISGVYKIINTITGDFYIGSSNNVKRRWRDHKCPSRWKKCPNNPLYQDMQKYGLDKFDFQILAEVEEEKLKEVEQQLIETLNPTYNNINANGWNIERQKESKRKAQKNYRELHKNEAKQYRKEYHNQLCFYNGETLTLQALSKRFSRKGIDHPTAEAKKYLLKQQ